MGAGCCSCKDVSAISARLRGARPSPMSGREDRGTRSEPPRVQILIGSSLVFAIGVAKYGNKVAVYSWGVVSERNRRGSINIQIRYSDTADG